MKPKSYLADLFFFLILVFCVGRIGFMCYNAELWPSADDPSVTGFSAHLWLKDMILTLFYGSAAHDIVMVCAMLFVPALFTLCGVKRLRFWLTPYYIILAVLIGVIIVADAVMYEFWQFKLSAVVFAYAAYPEGTANSVSPAFVATRLGTGILLMVGIAAGCIKLTPRRVEHPVNKARYFVFQGLTILCLLCSHSGVGLGYRSDRIFLNHATVNPVLAFVNSISLKDYADRYDYFDESERAQLFDGLYAGNGAAQKSDSATVKLLNTTTPDILVVFMESFGSEFVTSLGGAKGTTPDGRAEDVDLCLERLKGEGIWWTNYYSNSFRTDRGTVSAFCGWPSYTDVGLMTHTEYHENLSSLPKALRRAGYDTSYLYPGAMTNMGKGTFLGNIGFEHLLDDTFFTPDELDSTWGASDMTSARKTAATLSQPADKPRLFCYQTVSSHEPWEVPYARLTDKVQNAFAYTDAAVGMLIDSLKKSPVWDNLLVIVIPDHGHLYNVKGADSKLHRQAFDDPEFFHSPMLWLGGAVKEPCEMDVLMNQSDICATLLAQLGLGHGDFPWSRNVLSPDYTQPFVYSAFPAGLLFRDATGTTMFDVTADRVLYNAGKGEEQRVRSAKAILQTSYDGL